MAFYGCHFSFDGVSCFEHGLMIYDLGSPEEDGRFSSAVEIQEDRTSKRYAPLHYGVIQNTPLTLFSLTPTKISDAGDTYPHAYKVVIPASATKELCGMVMSTMDMQTAIKDNT